MALPQKAIEQLAREPVRTPGWSSRLLMFSSTIFIISLFIYLGLVFGYQPYLKSQVDRLDDQIANFSKEIAVTDQQKIITFYSQLANVQTLLEEHPRAAALFPWLERHTGANVAFTKMTFNAGTRELNVGGVAKSSNDIAEQTRIFQAQPEADRVNLRSLGIGAGGLWQFELSVYVSPAFLHREASSIDAGVPAAEPPPPAP